MTFRDDTYGFEKHLEQLKLLYEHECDANRSLRKTLNEYNKDTEVQEKQKQIDDLWRRSLLVMSPKEADAERAFRYKHYERHHAYSHCSTYTYEITGTGIGNIIKITCPICGESEDITDTDSW